ncbi:hypothetical protein D3C74_59770 [compost metagenome]
MLAEFADRSFILLAQISAASLENRADLLIGLVLHTSQNEQAALLRRQSIHGLKHLLIKINVLNSLIYRAIVPDGMI